MVFGVTVILLFIEHRGRIKPKNLGLILASAVIALAIASAVVPDSFWRRQKSIIAEQDRAIIRRASYILASWRFIKEDPFLGSGPGTFRDKYSRSSYAQKLVSQKKDKRRFAHNTYLEVLIGTGLIGFGLFLGLLLQGLKNFSKAKKRLMADRQEENAYLVGSYRLAYISLMVYLTMFSEPYHKYLLLSLPLSQVALNLSKKKIEGALPSLFNKKS